MWQQWHLNIVPIKGPHVHTCSAIYLAVTAVRSTTGMADDNGSNHDSIATAKELMEIQETMCLFCEELKQVKESGAIRVGTNPPGSGSTQVPPTSDNAVIPGSSEHRSGSANRKHGWETDCEQSNSVGVKDPDTADTSQTATFKLSEAGEVLLEAAFSKCMDTKSRTQYID